VSEPRNKLVFKLATKKLFLLFRLPIARLQHKPLMMRWKMTSVTRFSVSHKVFDSPWNLGGEQLNVNVTFGRSLSNGLGYRFPRHFLRLDCCRLGSWHVKSSRSATRLPSTSSGLVGVTLANCLVVYLQPPHAKHAGEMKRKSTGIGLSTIIRTNLCFEYQSL
jgi:hypothetical protein